MQSKKGPTIPMMLVVATVSVVVLSGTEGPSPSSNASSPNRPRNTYGRLIRHSLAHEDCPAADSTGKTPLLIHASASTFAFAADCLVDDVPNEQFAVYGRQEATIVHANAAFTAAPSVNEPTVPGTDTVTFFVQPDSITPRPDDFILMRQINDQRPEVVVYNVLTYPGRPFFQYYYCKHRQKSRKTYAVPSSWLPLSHTAAEHGSSTDTGTVALIDTLCAIEVNYSVTDGRSGPYEQPQQFSTIIPLTDLSRKSRLPSPDPVFRQASGPMVRAIAHRVPAWTRTAPVEGAGL